MRVIAMENMEVVSLGLAWQHDLPPCSRHAIRLLERNTKVVSWLMPQGGQPHEQIPCISYQGKYYSLSLRMQKAIYRHIRLKKGFKNEEVVNGLPKLRIPDLLLKEKIRTQSRFDAMRSGYASASSSSKKRKACDESCDEEEEVAAQQHKRKRTTAVVVEEPKKSLLLPQQERRARSKNTNTVASRMKHVVDRLIDSQRDPFACQRPRLTIFLYKSQQAELTHAFLAEIEKEAPILFKQRDAFLQLLAVHYDEFNAGR